MGIFLGWLSVICRPRSEFAAAILFAASCLCGAQAIPRKMVRDYTPLPSRDFLYIVVDGFAGSRRNRTGYPGYSRQTG